MYLFPTYAIRCDIPTNDAYTSCASEFLRLYIPSNEQVFDMPLHGYQVGAGGFTLNDAINFLLRQLADLKPGDPVKFRIPSADGMEPEVITLTKSQEHVR